MDSSDEEDVESDEEETGAAVDSSDEEDMWMVKAIHGEWRRGKGIQYDVEWETGERTWEPPSCFPANNEVLQKWKEAKSVRSA